MVAGSVGKLEARVLVAPEGTRMANAFLVIAAPPVSCRHGRGTAIASANNALEAIGGVGAPELKATRQVGSRQLSMGMTSLGSVNTPAGTDA